jgi:hypothetical protein
MGKRITQITGLEFDLANANSGFNDERTKPLGDMRKYVSHYCLFNEPLTVVYEGDNLSVEELPLLGQFKGRDYESALEKLRGRVYEFVGDMSAHAMDDERHIQEQLFSKIDWNHHHHQARQQEANVPQEDLLTIVSKNPWIVESQMYETLRIPERLVTEELIKGPVSGKYESDEFRAIVTVDLDYDKLDGKVKFLRFLGFEEKLTSKELINRLARVCK